MAEFERSTPRLVEPVDCTKIPRFLPGRETRSPSDFLFGALRAVINRLLADHSGQPIEKIERDVERDFIMSAQQAKEYGLIDTIIHKHR